MENLFAKTKLFTGLSLNLLGKPIQIKLKLPKNNPLIFIALLLGFLNIGYRYLDTVMSLVEVCLVR